MPRPGRITSLTVPGGPGIRDDSGVEVGFEVPIYYDSMISKLVAWGGDREQARHRMLRALGEYHVGGIPTTLPFFRWMLEQPAFVSGELDTTMLDAELERRAGEPFVAGHGGAPRDGAARHGLVGVPRRAPGSPHRRALAGPRYARAGRPPRGGPRSESRIPAWPCGFTSSRTGGSGRSRSPRVRRPRRSTCTSTTPS